MNHLPPRAPRSRIRRRFGYGPAVLAAALVLAAPPTLSAEPASYTPGPTAPHHAPSGKPAGRWIRAAGAPLTVFAHRGASSTAPENTLVSDEVARRGGAKWIENDVQPSKDGVPYILHDATVDRTTDGTGTLRSLTSAQLDALDAGSWFAPVFAGTRIPTLAAQLADLRTRGGNLLLEIKGRQTEAEVARIVQEVRDQGMTDRVFVQSFDVTSLRLAHELAPELPLGLLRDNLDADPVAVAEDLHLAAYNVSDKGLSVRPSAVDELHAAGIAVNVWTVNGAARWKVLDELGVDGVITDRPTELTGWIAGRRA
ncbi:glycerophosphodiester phosphodiesterase [Streptomyces vietnamensis]|uniref:Glycerophosphodiester phosphodiesterase n=1 Tax=Streptomyces vietnamensis TaxID=362257 RepID=A0A0B5I734_9ACTN|nr:glycerophosphodiester phosphodiesterase family protein [Streptomyces vietnamensis]AJF68416.1 glycerophosphodiester phosphodiesterase [Streptomyces vietnamensis]